MKPRRGHLRFDLVAARHNEHLVRRQNQPMTAKLIKTARGLEIPQVELEQILFSVSASAPHEGLFSLVKPCHMMCHVKNYQTLSRGKRNNPLELKVM